MLPPRAWAAANIPPWRKRSRRLNPVHGSLTLSQNAFGMFPPVLVRNIVFQPWKQPEELRLQRERYASDSRYGRRASAHIRDIVRGGRHSTGALGAGRPELSRGK